MFTQPKPTALLQFFIEVLAAERDALVLDFFAGSGTLGHAMLKANTEDGGSRRYIMSQLPEPTEYSETELRAWLPTICAVAREGMRRVASRMGEDIERVDSGFRAYELDAAGLVQDVEVAADSEAERLFTERDVVGRSDEALLTEILLARGFDLTEYVAWREVANASAADVADGALLICFTREMTHELFEALVAFEPAQLIVLEAGFGSNDEVKVNALQHLKTKNAHRDTPIELLVV